MAKKTKKTSPSAKAAKTAKATKAVKSSKPAGKLAASDATVLQRHSEVLSRRNADGTVAMLRLDSDDSFYTIDGIAAEFWLLIDDKLSIGQIKEKLVKRFQPPAPRFDRDVQTLVSELVKEKLVSA
jgi:hypothetical protein